MHIHHIVYGIGLTLLAGIEQNRSDEELLDVARRMWHTGAFDGDRPAGQGSGVGAARQAALRPLRACGPC